MSSASGPAIVVVVGNPRSRSRTLLAASSLAEALREALDAPDPAVVELADLAGELLAPEHPAADSALELVARADVLIVATPVYKASYTGLLKAFFDLYGGGALRGVVAVPVVVSASPAHSFAGEVHLRPLLVELGAAVPVRALALLEPQLTDLGAALDPWVAENAPALDAAVRAAGALRPVKVPS